MESEHYTQEINGVTNYIYSNEIYNLLIGTDGNINLGRRTRDSNAIISQLLQDLVITNMKMHNMLNAIEEGAKQGIVPAEYAQLLSEYVYKSENSKSRKK